MIEDPISMCPCGHLLPYSDCCQKVHLDQKQATSAEQLMRARYAAFVVGNINFLYASFHPATRRFQNKKHIEAWAKESKWMQLHILRSTVNVVEFEAHYLDSQLNLQIHHERSNFKEIQGIWYYVDGKLL
ncbi:zinc chelation protein SecC [Sphingobacterium sp. SRCM116780]|uniref:YchJ family protein n=1 Tax=Sphingobacterium sp. SRCM116780 TaxID=2907623 RepID=UPI001F3A53D4|nr:YchJ family metal-binding protein [Sphingobacterium sp. SRCM116780]UIR57249.1 zinc chelation protein SecC [Sphingobacterium sp. SRCM116780]